MPDVGLPQPDLLFFMDISPEETQTRGNYGEEIYEKLEFQKEVYDNFQEIMDETWTMIDATKEVEEIHEEISWLVQEKFEGEMEEFPCPLWIEE